MTQTADMPRDAGVSLLEMLVVLVVLALAAVMAAPALQGARGGQDQRAAVAELAALLRSERAQALRTGSERAVVIDLAARTVMTQQTALRLSQTLVLSATVPAADQLGASQARLRLYPDGSTSGARMTLATAGDASILTVDARTGALRIERRP